MKLHESGEMYLETILILSRQSPYVRAIDISAHMGYSKPSVSRAIGLLMDEGLVKKNDDGHLKLTEAGNIMAKSIYERHTVLTQLFINLGVDEKTAAEDACRMEHYISDASFQAVRDHVLNTEN